MFKNIKWNAAGKALLYLIGGLLLLVMGYQLEPYLTQIIGGVSIVVGALLVIYYLTLDVRDALFRNDFMEGLCLILFGIIVIVQRQVFAQLIPTILAALILLSGFSKVQDKVDAKRLGYMNHSTYLVLAIVSVIFGVILLFNLLKSEWILPFAGIGLVYCGISDLISAFYLSKKFRDFVKGKEEKTSEPEDKPEPVKEPEEEEEEHFFNERYDVEPKNTDTEIPTEEPAADVQPETKEQQTPAEAETEPDTEEHNEEAE